MFMFMDPPFNPHMQPGGYHGYYSERETNTGVKRFKCECLCFIKRFLLFIVNHYRTGGMSNRVLVLVGTVVLVSLSVSTEWGGVCVGG